MRILLVTDHKFLFFNNKVFDVFRIDQVFFEDYRYVFKKVSVLARLIKVDSLPEGARRSDGEGVNFIPGIHLAHRFFWVISSKLMNYRLIKKEIAAADRVIVRVPSELGTHAAFEAEKQEVPYLVEVVGDPEEAIQFQGRNPLYWILSKWEAYQLRKVVKKASAVSYVSKSLLQEKYPPLPGIYTDNISSIRLKKNDIVPPRDYSETPNPFKIVFLANFIPYKRHEDLINVCALLIRNKFNVELHFVGDGFTKDRLISLTMNLGLSDQVNFHGHISEMEKIYELLDNSDLFIIPSATEGVPRSILEAMARGLPVLGSNAGGIPELIQESNQFEVGDIDGLFDKIKNLFNNPGELTNMSIYSNKVAQRYADDILSKKRKKLYEVLRDYNK